MFWTTAGIRGLSYMGSPHSSINSLLVLVFFDLWSSKNSQLPITFCRFFCRSSYFIKMIWNRCLRPSKTQVQIVEQWHLSCMDWVGSIIIVSSLVSEVYSWHASVKPAAHFTPYYDVKELLINQNFQCRHLNNRVMYLKFATQCFQCPILHHPTAARCSVSI